MDKKLQQQLIDEYTKAFADTYEAGGGYGFRVDHGIRCMTYVEKALNLPYFQSKKVNKTAALIAALYADIGKVEALDEKREIIYGSSADNDHATIGARIVGDYIGKYISDNELLKFVSEIIEQQHGKEQLTIEAKLVKDVDRLDNYGAITAWRHITYATHDKRRIDRLNEFWVDEKAREKALGYLEKFHFDFLREIAQKRFDTFDAFLGEIEVEVEGEDIEAELGHGTV
jgi:HD superfamily phosphodiesterase